MRTLGFATATVTALLTHSSLTHTQASDAPAPNIAAETPAKQEANFIRPAAATDADDQGKVVPAVPGEDFTPAPPVVDDRLSTPDQVFRLTQGVSPLPAAPQTFSSAPSGNAQAQQAASRIFGGDKYKSLLAENRRTLADKPATHVVLGRESSLRVTTDAGSLLRKSSSSLGVASQQRSPIVTDPRIRGSQMGQLNASGSYWFPARPDLDTLVSKIDSRIVEDMIVIKGPYSARYGPGFNFVDFELKGAPRYESGPESHGSSGVDFNTNGEQWNGRQSLWGGGQDYGYRVGYGHRTGVDYETGNGVRTPSSYKSRALDLSLGLDLDSNSDIEFTMLRVDQTDVELPHQVYDIDSLVTDSGEIVYRRRNGANFDLLSLEGWYNHTRFDGNNLSPAKRRQLPVLDLDGWRGVVDAANLSTGATLEVMWGDEDGANLVAGLDFRYLMQRIDQFDVATVLRPAPSPPSPRPAFGLLNTVENYPLPESYTINPGLFAELTRPVNDKLTIKVGGRADLVEMDASNTAPLAFVSDPSDKTVSDFYNTSLTQHFELASFFVTGEYDVNQNVTANAGGGFAMRTPTMFQLYSVIPFANVMAQQATSRVFGHPQLTSEKRWQVDTGVNADYGDVRAGAAGYYAWISDYITLDQFFTNPVDGIPLYGYVNTDLATIAGVELYTELDLTDAVTVFGNMSYTEGRDRSRNSSAYFNFLGASANRSGASHDKEPLPMIAPLETRLGVRVQEPCSGRYGVEFTARIVDNQDRVARSLLESETPGFTTYDIRGFLQATECLSLVAGVENLTDKNYQEYLDPRAFSTVFQPGINFYFGSELVY